MLLAAYMARGTPKEQRLPREDFMAAFGGQTGPTPGAFPELHGKANHLRHLVPALFDVCSRINMEQNLNADEHIHRLEALRLLVEFEEICDQGGEVLSDAKASRLLEVANDFCLRQNFLELLP
jgi:hypothetical protein